MVYLSATLIREGALRIWHILVTIAVLGMALVLAACGQRPLLSEVSFSAERITPNADGDTDAVVITYDLARSADLSIYLDDETGNRYYFRNHVHQGPSVEGPYQVLFAGVVDGYALPGEQFEGFVVKKRVLQDGIYTWTV